MFRVYVEGKSPENLIANVEAFLAILKGGSTKEFTTVTTIKTELPTIEPIDLPEGMEIDEEVLSSDCVPSECDSRGVPWNAKIHSASKATTKDGSWRTRRGADEFTVENYESKFLGKSPKRELLQPEAPEHIEQTVATITAPLPFLIPDVVEAPVVVAPLTVAPVYTAPIPPMLPTKPAHSFDTFKSNFVPTMAGLVASKELTQDYIQELNKYFQVSQIMDVRLDDTKCRQLFDALVQGGKITQVG